MLGFLRKDKACRHGYRQALKTNKHLKSSTTYRISRGTKPGLVVTVKQQLRPIGLSVSRQYLPLKDRKGQAVLVSPDLIDSSARVVPSMANDQGSM